MVFQPVCLQADHSAYPVIGSSHPVFSWGAFHEEQDQYQTAAQVTVTDPQGNTVWDSGFVSTEEQQMAYGGPALKDGCQYRYTVRLKDKKGLESASASACFLTPLYGTWQAPFIAAREDRERQAPYFRKEFFVQEGLSSAVLFCCGLGYQKVTANGRRVEDGELQPAHSDYSRRCHYTVSDLTGLLRPGQANCLGVILGEGWRRNKGPFVHQHVEMAGRQVTFFGQPVLSAHLLLRYEDGREETILTDESWQYRYGAYVMNNLFDGERYDARLEQAGFDLPGYPAGEKGFEPAKRSPAPGPKIEAQTIPPIRVKQSYRPVSVSMPKPGCWLLDFGQNLAGVLRLRLPASMKAGETVTLRHAEELDEEDLLFTEVLRCAQCTDTYTSAGSGREEYYQPSFTYHGFRYASVEGYPGLLTPEDVTALAFYTDIDNSSSFECGSPAINAIQKLVVQTERANLHSIATDCPQRDERMGWMNDATVRFEETPFNFDTGRLFPKIIGDFQDVQGEDGSITCTVPFVFGNRPADPVCSSYLVLGMQALLHFDDKVLAAQAYPGFAAWNRYLSTRLTPEGTVDYTYYGDWAAPADSCLSMEDARSSSTPGEFMSTGYYYYNSLLLAQFAKALEKEQEQAFYLQQAQQTRQAILNKWWDGETGRMATGSQACQAFALWLGLIPEEKEQLAAQQMHQAVLDAGTRLTTGNLCTRYLMDMLAKYGYADTFYDLLVREEYPSWGFMLQNAATTVWERFELKKNGGMNSHNHPMYGAVGSCFYTCLAGLSPLEYGWKRFRVSPVMPKQLLYVKACVHTCRGEIQVKWHKKYDETFLSVSVPFGCRAKVALPVGVREIGSGYHLFRW